MAQLGVVDIASENCLSSPSGVFMGLGIMDMEWWANLPIVHAIRTTLNAALNAAEGWEASVDETLQDSPSGQQTLIWTAPGISLELTILEDGTPVVIDHFA